MPRVAITVPGKTPQPYRFKLDRKKVSIGRSSDCDIVVDCTSVSSLHCTMERIDGGYILRDRKSTNGITLDEEEMSVIDLRNDSDVKVGDVTFDYSLSDEELDDLDDEEFAPHSKTADEFEDDDDDEDELEPEPKKEAQKPKKKAKVIATPAQSASPVVPPTLASSNQGSGGLYGIALFVCGVLALYAGLDQSYRGKQTDAGREGEFSLFSDIINGRPKMPEAKDEDAK